MSDNMYLDQQPMAAVTFAENPEPRCPCLLLLDTSGSMAGEAIAELNAGIKSFYAELQSDSLAIKRVEVALMTFGPVQVISEFNTAECIFDPELVAEGDTPIGEAIRKGIELIRARKEQYRANGISFYRPWIFLITDGAPTDEWQSAASLVREGEASKSFAFFTIGVNKADMKVLKQISVREPVKLQGLKFREFFQWLSNSMKSASRSNPGDRIQLAPPLGWSEI
ncbi:VWA domain-containing protein [Methanoregula sp.]|uniref:vWA domain-containing protein n=1 Tax=Methanoregula sp. TaxID=2052170 RepID=UPI0026148A52|nr:VWA domain-containing protein [Methanoregula sp.]MDD5142335.1 VWA domain-containing protein [Methanoregula sp.]